MASLPGSAYYAFCLKSPGPLFSQFEITGVGGAYQKTGVICDQSGGLDAAGSGSSGGYDTAAHSMIYTYNGGANTTTGNYTSFLDGANNALSSSGAMGQPATDFCSIGADINNAGAISLGFVGLIGELIVTNAVMSTSQMVQLSEYFASLWGTTP